MWQTWKKLHEVEGEPRLVLDTGSYLTKVGIAGENKPTSVFRSVIARPIFRRQMSSVPVASSSERDLWVGNEAIARLDNDPSSVSCRCPIEHGIETNWDNMEKIWDHAFKAQLKVDTEDHLLLLTEAPMHPKANREIMTQIMFETYDFPGYCTLSRPILSLYATGNVTGLVLECGHAVTHAMCVYDGFSLSHTIHQSCGATGESVDNYLAQLLVEEQKIATPPTTPTQLSNVAGVVKRNLGYVPMNGYKEEIENYPGPSLDKTYQLPDGQQITLGVSTRSLIGEAFFSPDVINLSDAGVQFLASQSLLSCEVDLHEELLRSVVIGGGSSMLPGFVDRFEKELKKELVDAEILSAHERMKMNVIPERQISAWIGGSAIASLSIFPEMCISRDLYEENGPFVIHRKCWNN